MVQLQTEPDPRTSLKVNYKWCKGCSLCVCFCPRGILSLDSLGKVKIDRPEECVACGMCEATCPDFAIRVEKNAQTD